MSSANQDVKPERNTVVKLALLEILIANARVGNEDCAPPADVPAVSKWAAIHRGPELDGLFVENQADIPAYLQFSRSPALFKLLSETGVAENNSLESKQGSGGKRRWAIPWASILPNGRLLFEHLCLRSDRAYAKQRAFVNIFIALEAAIHDGRHRGRSRSVDASLEGKDGVPASGRSVRRQPAENRALAVPKSPLRTGRSQVAVSFFLETTFLSSLLEGPSKKCEHLIAVGPYTSD